MTADTAATAALGPEPIPGSGPGATADDDTPVARAHFRAWEDQLAAEDTCSHPIQLRSRTDMIDTATGELAPLYGQASVACGNRREVVCPSCSATYKRDARQLVRAGLAGGKGIPETITGAPVRVRHPHRAVVRPGPLPADARQDRPALPSPPRRQGPPLPARPRHLLPDPARRDRPPARPAHVRRLLRLPSRGAVQRPRGRPVAPVHHLPAPPPGLAGRGHPEGRCTASSASGSSRSPSTRHAASSTSTPSSAWTPPARTTSPRPPPTPLTCCATPSAWPPLPPRSSSTTRTRP